MNGRWELCKSKSFIKGRNYILEGKLYLTLEEAYFRASCFYGTAAQLERVGEHYPLIVNTL